MAHIKMEIPLKNPRMIENSMPENLRIPENSESPSKGPKILFLQIFGNLFLK